MKRLKRLFERFTKQKIEEPKAEIPQVADEKRPKQGKPEETEEDLPQMVKELDVFGGLMGRKEFIKKLKHAIRLVDLRKEWIESSIYGRQGLPEIETLINLEREITAKYNKARREGNEKDALLAQGGLDALAAIKEVLE